MEWRGGPGEVWLDLARRGEAWSGMAGLARQGADWIGKVTYGDVRSGQVRQLWRSTVGHGVAGRGNTRIGKAGVVCLG